MTIIAVDPGKSGGLARYKDGYCVAALPMPATEKDLIEILGAWCAEDDVVVYVEQVGGYTGRGQPGSAMFNFGWWAGGPVWIAQCYNARVVLIRPQKWQKLLSLGKSDGDKAKWKNKLKAMAQRLFPTFCVTLKTADALLILHVAIALEK